MTEATDYPKAGRSQVGSRPIFPAVMTAALIALSVPADAQPAPPSNTTVINGALLGAGVQQRNADRVQHAEAFRLAMKGFPREAFTVKVDNIATLPANPDQINVQYTLGFSPTWLSQLRANLSALAIAKFSVRWRPGPVGGDLDTRMWDVILQGKVGTQFGARFCILGAAQSECYLLPEADYGQGFVFQDQSGLSNSTQPPVISLRMFAADGTPTSACLVRYLGIRPNVQDTGDTVALSTTRLGMQHAEWQRQKFDYFLGRTYNLYVDPAPGAFYVLTKEADFAKSTRMDIRPFFGAYRNPGQPPALVSNAVGRPNGYAVPDITELPTERDVCKLP